MATLVLRVGKCLAPDEDYNVDGVFGSCSCGEAVETSEPSGWTQPIQCWTCHRWQHKSCMGVTKVMEDLGNFLYFCCEACIPAMLLTQLLSHKQTPGSVNAPDVTLSQRVEAPKKRLAETSIDQTVQKRAKSSRAAGKQPARPQDNEGDHHNIDILDRDTELAALEIPPESFRSGFDDPKPRYFDWLRMHGTRYISEAQQTSKFLGHAPLSREEVRERIDEFCHRKVNVIRTNAKYSELQLSYRKTGNRQRPFTKPEDHDFGRGFQFIESKAEEDVCFEDRDGKVIAYLSRVDDEVMRIFKKEAAKAPQPMAKHFDGGTRFEPTMEADEPALAASQRPKGPSAPEKPERSKQENAAVQKLMCWHAPGRGAARLVRKGQPNISSDIAYHGAARWRTFFKETASIYMWAAKLYWFIDLQGASKLAHLDLDDLPKDSRPPLPALWHGIVINSHIQPGVGCKVHRDINDDPECMTVLIPYGDFEGGDIILWDLHSRIKLLEGQALFFYGSILDHSSTEVTKGERASVVIVAHKALLVGGPVDANGNRRAPQLAEGNESAEEMQAESDEGEVEMENTGLTGADEVDDTLSVDGTNMDGEESDLE